MGNSKARAVYEANLPDNYKRPQTDSPLEQFIRAKYEQRKWIAKEWIPPNISALSTDVNIINYNYILLNFYIFKFNEDEPKEKNKEHVTKQSQKIELEVCN
jgi:hypothetical protein